MSIDKGKRLLEVSQFANNAIKVRKWERQHLPVEQSALAMDLFLIIAHNTLLGAPLTLKALFNSVDFSEAGVRKHLRRMLTEGWCALEGSDHDKRLRFVVAQPKMLDSLSSYLAVVREAYGVA